MKYLKLIFLIFVVSFFATAKSGAVVPTWAVTPGDFSYNMTVTGVINLNFIESTDPNDMVGAFVGGQCRGVQNLVFDAGTGRYLAYLMVYSNNVSGVVNFKIYDASADIEIDIPVTMIFSVDGITGSTDAPYIWSNPTLSSQANILTYTIPGQAGGTTYTGNNINITMPFGTDLTNLIANYTTSPYARMQVAGITQTSGTTPNNFNTPLIYNVRSADETTTQNYNVNITLANAVPTDIYLSSTNINETSPTGTTIGTLTSEDGNLTDSHTYSFIAGTGDTDNGNFNISPNQLQLNTVLNYETKITYSIRIQTDDGNGGLFEKQFTINVNDKNDESPQVTSDAITLPENEPLQAVHTMLATDADITPAFKILNYSITTGNIEGKFAIEPTNGVISLISNLDFETTTTYELEITVSDGINSNIGILTVTVSDINDETPQVTNATNQVLESVLSGEQITQIQATDADANSTLTYSITGGNTGSAFSINSATGIVTLTTNLDFETTQAYSLNISVSDGINTGTGTLTINIVDVNDELPVVSAASISVSETTVVGTAIHTVLATDADANTILAYSIVSGNTNNHFGINANTGVIRVDQALDFEKLTIYNLVVAAFDGIHSSTGIISINIIDQNDEVPQITNTTAYVYETQSIGFSVTNIQAVDADANTTLTYYITSGNTSGKFAVNQNTGEITLAGMLNYELTSQYVLGIRAYDGANNGTGTITINIQAVNDEFPVITSSTVNIEESAIFGQIVHTMLATDPDGGSILTYSITGGNINSAFTIDPDHGIVTVLGSLDYETTPNYTLEVTVDDGLHQTVGTLTVNLLNLNDETPLVTNATVSINENKVVGSQIITVSAIDPDGTTALTYSIIAGNAGNVFQVEPSTGIITVAAGLDYETTTSYQLTIGVNDGVETGNGTITININDINDETPLISGQIVNINETLPVSSEILTVSASDPDVGTTLSYSITSGNLEGKFLIDASTGKITVANPLDYETTTFYTLGITVNDGVSSASETFKINIIDKNDEIPIMQDAVVYVAENAALGFAVQAMQATDADAGTVFSFAITAGNKDNKFSINKYLGVISLIDNLDYETKITYTLEISVSDGVHTTLASVLVNVTDIDDNAPTVENEEINVEETATIGSIIYTIKASDADAISVLSYSIFTGNAGNVFLINPTSGAITLAGKLDFEKLTDYVLQVDVTDGTSTATGIITIHIDDMNDETPVLADTIVSISEFSDIGVVIGQLSATDADANSSLTYSISAGNESNLFSLSLSGNTPLIFKRQFCRN